MGLAAHGGGALSLAELCDPGPVDGPDARTAATPPASGPASLGIRDRALVEWVAQAAVGDPFPEPWSYASQPLVSMIRTLMQLGVIEQPPPDAPLAEVARGASAAARTWLEANPV